MASLCIVGEPRLHSLWRLGHLAAKPPHSSANDARLLLPLPVRMWGPPWAVADRHAVQVFRARFTPAAAVFSFGGRYRLSPGQGWVLRVPWGHGLPFSKSIDDQVDPVLGCLAGRGCTMNHFRLPGSIWLISCLPLHGSVLCKFYAFQRTLGFYGGA